MYVEVPKEMNKGKHMILLVVKTLYGIPESGQNWYLTYLDYFLTELKIKQIHAYPCVMVWRINGVVDGPVDLKVDDDLSFESKRFMKYEQDELVIFVIKKRTYLEYN